jgi:hypothetical protein
LPGADISLLARRAATVHPSAVRLIGLNPLPPFLSPPVEEDLDILAFREMLSQGHPKIRLFSCHDYQRSNHPGPSGS